MFTENAANGDVSFVNDSFAFRLLVWSRARICSAWTTRPGLIRARAALSQATSIDHQHEGYRARRALSGECLEAVAVAVNSRLTSSHGAVVFKGPHL